MNSTLSTVAAEKEVAEQVHLGPTTFPFFFSKVLEAHSLPKSTTKVSDNTFLCGTPLQFLFLNSIPYKLFLQLLKGDFFFFFSREHFLHLLFFLRRQTDLRCIFHYV